MKENVGKFRGMSPANLRLLAVLCLSIFVWELLIMLVLPHVHTGDRLSEAVLDSVVLVILQFPALYFFVLRKLMSQNAALKKAQTELRLAHDHLEIRVEERTKELSCAVDQLERRQRLMSELSELSMLFQASRSLEETRKIAERKIPVLLDGHPGHLFLLNSSHDLLDRIVSWGSPYVPKNTVRTLSCWALRCGHSLDVAGEGHSIPCCHMSEGENGLYRCIPMMAQGEASGVLSVRVKEANGSPDDTVPPDEEMLEMVAETLGLAFVNVQLREKLEHQAVRDPLTGVFNRRYLSETVDRELARAAREGIPLSFLIFDVDHFKDFNDTHGHDAGDAVLVTVARALSGGARKSDVVARYGGEEFAIVMPHASSDEAFRRAEVLRKEIASLRLGHQKRRLERITISCGIATYPDDAQDKDMLFKAADEALYLSKASGRNCVTIARTMERTGETKIKGIHMDANGPLKPRNSVA